MGTNEKLPVLPTQSNLTKLKADLVTGTKGHSLMKKNCEAMEIKLLATKGAYLQQQEKFKELIQSATLSLAKGKFYGFHFAQIRFHCHNKANCFIGCSYENEGGVSLPRLRPIIQDGECNKLAGLGGGGQQLNYIRKEFQQITRHIVDMATSQIAVEALEVAIRKAKIKVNFLEYVRIPKIEVTIAYIKDNMDESGREDFYRMKKIQERNRKQHKEHEHHDHQDHKDMERSLQSIEEEISDIEWKK